MIFESSKAKRVIAVLEFETDNKLHKKIGYSRWMLYRPMVPDYIPAVQVERYIFALIRKNKRGHS